MRKLISIILCCTILVGCSASALESEEKGGTSVTYHVSRITSEEGEEEMADTGLKGIWVSQFDMHPIYRNGSKQRDKQDYESKVRTMINNLKRDGFNSIFLQLRPNGDSIYESAYYPMSKYISGIYGGEIEYDAVEIFLHLFEEIVSEIFNGVHRHGKHYS